MKTGSLPISNNIKTAFTLVELLVVIAIIGILSGLIIVGMSGMTQSANIAKGQVFSSSLRDSLLMSLISEWKFDELTTAVNGTVIQDSWSEGRTATLSTGDALEKLKTGGDCVSGKCLQFDGVDDYITTTAFALTGTVLTLSVWAKIQDKTPGSAILSDNAQSATVGYIYSYRSSSSNSLSWEYANGASASSASSSAFFDGYNNAWVLITIVCDYTNKTTSFYRNGSLINTVVMTGTPVFPSANRIKYFGRYNPTHAYVFLGYLDDLRIFNAAIPAFQIREEYYAGLNNLLAKGEIDKNEYENRLLAYIK